MDSTNVRERVVPKLSLASHMRFAFFLPLLTFALEISLFLVDFLPLLD
jgi:hypothetical protein